MYSKGAVEAALFSSAEPVSVSSIAERTGQTEEEVNVALIALIAEYEERGSAIRIVRLGNDYRMQLSDDYTEIAGEFAKVELTKGMMKTLVTIAYNQPIMQSELNKNLGARVYDDVRALREMGLVSGKSIGQSLELTTTKKFSEYFGIGSTRKEDIREWIEKSEKRARR